jgi:hypothetical protein
VQELPSTILRERLPRTLSYPVTEALLSSAFAGICDLDHLAVYFVYDSSPQLLRYDPVKSTATSYPVLVIRKGLPVFRVPTLTGNLAYFDDTRSVLVFPVKARIRPAVTDAIREQGLRPLQKWLSASADPALKQRPLLLSYDEVAHRIAAKFAEDWPGDELDREYF